MISFRWTDAWTNGLITIGYLPLLSGGALIKFNNNRTGEDIQKMEEVSQS